MLTGSFGWTVCRPAVGLLRLYRLFLLCILSYSLSSLPLAANEPFTTPPPVKVANVPDAAPTVLAAGVYCASRPHDEVWLISSRHIGCPSTDDSRLQYLIYSNNCWENSDVKAFEQSLANDPEKLTTVFVHGNRTDLAWAKTRGTQAYENLVVSSELERPVRYIIWAWPSDQVRGPLRDVRAKADRADVESYLFGRFLSRLPSDSPVSLIGYSLGSRVVLGGLTLLTSNPLFGTRLDLPEGYAPPPTRVSLIAAAVNNNALMPNARYGQAYGIVDKLVLVNNSSDSVLKFYKFLDRQNKIPAMGFSGLPISCLNDRGDRVYQCDVSGEVGSEHNIGLYLQSDSVARVVKPNVLWIDDEKKVELNPAAK